MQSVSTFSGRGLWGSVCEKSFRFLRFSRFWRFFQICNIPLLSARNQHAKCFNIFRPDAVRVRWGRGGTGCGNYSICSQSPGKIHHISSFPIVRHLVRPPVATYGSCLLTCLIISFKKPYKGWILKKCLKQLRKKTKSFRIRYFFQFFVLNNFLSKLTLNYCEHYMATPGGIRVKIDFIIQVLFNQGWIRIPTWWW
jgi:hypothetical protein